MPPLLQWMSVRWLRLRQTKARWVLRFFACTFATWRQNSQILGQSVGGSGSAKSACTKRLLWLSHWHQFEIKKTFLNKIKNIYKASLWLFVALPCFIALTTVLAMLNIQICTFIYLLAFCYKYSKISKYIE